MAKNTTQDFLKFNRIRDGVVILKNKGLRVVLMASSVNFALKSDEEQESILYAFQSFLNSLDFSCQIIVNSRKINITGYIEKLEEIEKKEEEELLQMQISEYNKFIKNLVQEGSIMQKSFYVAVPFSIAETRGISTAKKFQKGTELTEVEFQRAKNQLFQRVEFVILGLRACGIEAVPLRSLELAELFWGLHHPLEAERGYYPEIPADLT